MEDESYISIFKGPVVEADQVHEYLEQNEIGSLVRNHMHENLSAGWMISESDRSAEVFVSREDYGKAKELLKNIFNEGLDADTKVEKE